MMSIHDYEEMKLARLRAYLAEGEAQIERGEYSSIDNKQELHEFFDDIKTKNRDKKA
jgi:hypothetical protein